MQRNWGLCDRINFEPGECRGNYIEALGTIDEYTPIDVFSLPRVRGSEVKQNCW